MIDAKRMLREIRILNEFKHENIISLERVIFNEHPKLDFGEVYLVSNLMDVDLNTLIKKSKNDLTDDHIQYIMYQIFRSLKFLHSGGVIHRDIKPSNILANESCDIRVCDFGFARDAGEDTANVELTEYVVTRFYRAPEVMLSSQRYTTVIPPSSKHSLVSRYLVSGMQFLRVNFRRAFILGQKLPRPSENDDQGPRQAFRLKLVLHHKYPCFILHQKTARHRKKRPNR